MSTIEVNESVLGQGVQIISRSDLPIHSINREGNKLDVGELRILSKNPLINEILSSSGKCSLAYTSLAAGQVIAPHSHDFPAMMIIAQGNGKLIGEETRDFKAGDIIAVPANHQMGLIGGEPQGFQGISVEMHKSSEKSFQLDATQKEHNKDYSYVGLVAYNDLLFKKFLQVPFFRMLQEGKFGAPAVYSKYLDCMQVWSSSFQTLLYSRQATSFDPAFRDVFLTHLQEEIGHDVLHAKREDSKKINDPILEAICSWFSYKMFVCDNFEKAAIVHLVLETSGDYYHAVAEGIFGKKINSDFYHVHAVEDSGHAEMGIKLLSGQNEDTYKRLYVIIEEAWNMHAAMFSRIIQLVNDDRSFNYVVEPS